MFKNILCKDSPIPKFIHLKIWCWDGVESLNNLEEGEFEVSIDDCISDTPDDVIQTGGVTYFFWHCINPLLLKVFFVTCLPKGVVTTPS